MAMERKKQEWMYKEREDPGCLHSGGVVGDVGSQA